MSASCLRARLAPRPSLLVWAALAPWMPAGLGQLPSVEWQPAGETAHARVEYTPSGRKVGDDGVVTAFTRYTLVAGLDERRRARIDELRAAGLPARGYERFLRQVRRSDYDCARRRIRTLSVVDYDDAGRVLAWADAEGSDVEWSPVEPDTIGSRTLAAVCADAPRSTLRLGPQARPGARTERPSVAGA